MGNEKFLPGVGQIHRKFNRELTGLASLGMMRNLSKFARKGERLKKAIWLLPGFIFLAGCGGTHYKAHQNFLSPAPAALIQEFSLFSPDPGEASSGPSPEALTFFSSHPREEAEPNSEPEPLYCDLNDPSLVIYDPEMVSMAWSTPAFGSGRTLEPGQQETKVAAASLEVAVEEIAVDSTSPSAPVRQNSEKEAGKILGASLFISEPPDSSDASGYEIRESAQLPGPEETLQTLFHKEKGPEESVLDRRLSSQLLGRMPSLLNDRVKDFIDFFQNKADGFFTRSLARSQAYEGMMKQIFREKNLPEELFYLALIESGYNPQAQSRAKAQGIWQFMSKTAQRFGLKVDKWVDERRDPEKSTQAAAEYLKSLHEMFNCWYLATASYNAGEGKMLQAMKKANSQDFWEISKHRYLKRETKEYVPMFLAAMIIAQDPQKYGFSNIEYQRPLLYEKVSVPPGTRLDRIARAAETDLQEIRTLNPSLSKDRTPPGGPSFEVKIPPGKREVFEANLSQMKIFDSRKSRKHEVRRGETLGKIAKKYRIDLQDLCEGNQITPRTPIRPGMTLLLPPK